MQPAERKVHGRPMPRVGGIAMAVGVAVPLLLWLDLDRLTAAYLASALIVLLFGVWDDRATLSPGIKFLGQLIAVHIVVLVGGVEIHSLTFASRIELPEIIAAPLTVLFLLGVTNAINLSDGLDGLAGGTTFLCCVAIALVELRHGPCVRLYRRRRRHGQPAGLPALQQFSGAGVHGRRRQPVSRLHRRRAGRAAHPERSAAVQCGLAAAAAWPADPGHADGDGDSPARGTLAVLRRQEPPAPSVCSVSASSTSRPWRVIYLLQGVLFLLAWQLRYHSDLTIVAVFLGFAATLLLALFAAERRGWRWHGLGEFRLGTARISETLCG